MASTVTSKGQVTIPKPIRDALGIEEGMRVEFTLEPGRAVLKPLAANVADVLSGSLRAHARKRGTSDRDLMKRVRRKVAREAIEEGRPARYQRHPQVPPRR